MKKKNVGTCYYEFMFWTILYSLIVALCLSQWDDIFYPQV